MNNALITWITETEANCSIAASYTPKEFQLFSTLKENKSPTAFPRQCVDTGNNKETTPPPFPQFLSLLVECAPHSDLNNLSLSLSFSDPTNSHPLLPPPASSSSIGIESFTSSGLIPIQALDPDHTRHHHHHRHSFIPSLLISTIWSKKKTNLLLVSWKRMITRR